MANVDHLVLLQLGYQEWNQYRFDNPGFIPDLSEANLSRMDLKWFNLDFGNFNKCVFSQADMRYASMLDCNFNQANFWRADMRYAMARNSNFNMATLSEADLSFAAFTNCNMNAVVMSNTVTNEYTEMSGT